MSGRAPRRTARPQRPPLQRDYDLPRWRDLGSLSRRKSFVRKAAEVHGDREAVVKHSADLPGPHLKPFQRVRLQRFHQEARYMHRMTGTPGILPVWDIDEEHGDRPRWYAMPQARPLADALDGNSTLLDVVAHVTELAGTLAALAEQGTYHRDIKPDNLFWYDGAPVLGDFGIAAIAQMPAGLTRQGEGLGPANFLAPEMRRAAGPGAGERADVYSLAKTLFVLAHPRRGPYPPFGTHRVDAEEFSLWSLGGGNATLALGHVLEAATQHTVGDRLTMADFHAELRAWLGRHREDTARFTPLGGGSFRRGWGDPALWDRHHRDEEATRAMLLPCVRRIAEALTGDPGAWTEGIDHDNGDSTLGTYDWQPNSEEGFVPEGFLWMATHAHDGRRIVLEAVLDHEVCFLAEAQRVGPPWTLERQWGHTPWHRARMPRTHDRLRELTDEVVEWIARSTPDTSLAPDTRPAPDRPVTAPPAPVTGP
ncbi:serine/threonine-protein kinase [Streptomyces achromogenes]|uniref:serine/threonine-protein kinase n=1 Tax=Streptomyces achromogenes TaxID=67255 RepID=UPI0012FE9CE9|nr:protein kinase [Streptomyces achromogenes]